MDKIYEYDGKPIKGEPCYKQIRFTAVEQDGGWSVYDNKTDSFARNVYKMKAECQAKIGELLANHDLPYERVAELSPYKHKFVVDVHWDVARTYEVEAESREEAQAIIQARVDKGDICVWTDHFEATDDVDVSTSGQEMWNGEIEYF